MYSSDGKICQRYSELWSVFSYTQQHIAIPYFTDNWAGNVITEIQIAMKKLSGWVTNQCSIYCNIIPPVSDISSSWEVLEKTLVVWSEKFSFLRKDLLPTMLNYISSNLKPPWWQLHTGTILKHSFWKMQGVLCFENVALASEALSSAQLA